MHKSAEVYTDREMERDTNKDPLGQYHILTPTWLIRDRPALGHKFGLVQEEEDL